ncbi:MAG: ZIP family metal transporter [Betaproteobacteria bacterium]|nr:ZIP family metal transporter [Betaproteobacteria bacterium]
MTAMMMTARRGFAANTSLIAIAAGLALLLGAGVYAYIVANAMLAGLVASSPAVAAALVATLGTALATGAGALPVLFVRRISASVQDTMLGFAAGVMLAASVFSLILPAIDAGTTLTGAKLGGALIAAAGVLLGGTMLAAGDRLLPHEHIFKGHEGPPTANVSRVWLFIFAITLHNVPEGLAVGVGFAGGDAVSALPLALGIAVQNIPEGLAVALALLTLKYSPARAALIALATGMVEPIGGLIGAGVVTLSAPLLPWGLAFAGGAMLYVISHEIIPETHRNGHESRATAGLLAGFVLMMMFDTMLA